MAAALPIELFHAPKFTNALHELAVKGYCVWSRAEGWIKIWSSVIAFDVWGYRLVGDDGIFVPWPVWRPFKMSAFLPKRRSTLEGQPVYIPHHPTVYLDQMDGVGGWETPLECTHVQDKKCME